MPKAKMNNMVIKRIVDVAMTVLLLCLMAYQVTGEMAYEWIGMGMAVLVFATPLYYYGMSAQLKTVIDRFCAYNSSLNSRHLKSALLTVAWNSDDWTFDALKAHYKTLVRYINFQDCGMVLGHGCGTPGMTKRSGYPQKAYQLGRGV